MDKKFNFKRAVGLQYFGSGVPEVSLKGFGVSADEIVRIAKRHGVPVVEHAHAAKVLQQFEMDEPIPESLFEIIATILHELDA